MVTSEVTSSSVIVNNLNLFLVSLVFLRGQFWVCFWFNINDISGSISSIIQLNAAFTVLLKTNNKATRMLHFLHRNLYRCSQEVKCTAPCETYAGVCIVYHCVGPLFCQNIFKNALEMVQRRAMGLMTGEVE